MMKSLAPLLPALFAVSLLRPALGASPPAPHMLTPAAKLERVSSGFGYRHDGFHPGLDLAAPYGSAVRAALPGKVVYAGWDGGYGKLVELRSAGGLVTRYAHLSRIARYVTRGQELVEGKTLGNIGATGNAHGPHLHFEVMVNHQPVNPVPYLLSSPAVSESDETLVETAEITGHSGGYHIGRRPVHQP